MKYSIKEISLISVISSLTIILGFIFYITGRIIPLPGSKFIFLSPFLGFILFIPVYKIKKVGTITLISLIISFIMFFVNIFMGLAIISSGIITDLITAFFFRNYKNNWNIIASVSFYPVAAIVLSFLIARYFTGNLIIKLLNYSILIMICITVYLLAAAGAYLSCRILHKQLKRIFH